MQQLSTRYTTSVVHEVFCLVYMKIALIAMMGYFNVSMDA